MPKEKQEFNLIEEKFRSKFLNDLLKDEYEELVRNNYFTDNHVIISDSYIIENQDSYEVGAYITNNSSKALFLRELPVALIYDEKIISKKTLKLNNKINGNEAIFLEIEFSKEEIEEDISNSNELSIAIGDFSYINRFIYREVDYLGLEKVRETSSYSAIKKFIKSLALVEKGKLALDVFTVGEIEEGLFIVILIRNYFEEKISLMSLPVEVYTENDILFYKGDILFNNEGIEVEGNSGIFKVVVIPKNEIDLIFNENEHSYKVKITN